MIIKKANNKKKNTFINFSKFLYFYFFSTLLALSILILSIFQSQTFHQKKNSFLSYISDGGRYEYLYLPQIVFKALKSNFYKIEKIDIEIPFEKIVILENVRQKAIENGVLPNSLNMPRVKANIIHNEKKYRGEIRLKGDRDVHWKEKNKSSYKIELDKDKYLFGIKKFSIQKPRVRNYIHEWIFLELAKKQNLIKINYDFVELYINGEDKGLYVIEEGFGKELIERNRRRNGPIFGLNEDIYEGFDNPVFETYNKKFWELPENNLTLRIASQKLRDFFNNKSKPEELFDLEKWAAFFAIVDLTSNFHGAYLKSVKFYYNPLNGLFEPIPFDGHRLKPNFHEYNLNYDNRILIDIIQAPRGGEAEYTWIKKFFYEDNRLNTKFYDMYLSNLNKISSEKYIDNFLTDNDSKIEEINSHIYADYFFYDNSRNYGIGLYFFLKSDLRYQAKNIRDKIKSSNRVQLLKIDDGNYLIKNFYKNYGSFEATKMICEMNNNQFLFDLNQRVNNFEDTLISVSFDNVKNYKCNSLELSNKLTNKKKLLNVDHLNSEYSHINFKRKHSKNLNKYFKKSNNSLILLKDEIEINENIYIPSGTKVKVFPGQKISIINNAFIISNSPWEIGGKGKQVIISGKESNLGGGILIGDTNDTTIIENTEFSFLGGYDLKKNLEYIILGSVNFHQTSIKIKNTNFKNIFSEDAINIFRTKFDIYNSNYSKIFSDAIDVDFSNGKITQAYFENINNDAIDFSGSKVDIKDTSFKNVNDKIISAGEDSRVYINKINGINSFAGIISKDGSQVYSNNVYFDGVKIPFASYQKKNEYNYPFLKNKKYELYNFLTKSIKDETSFIDMKDESVVMKSEEIIPLIYEKNLSLIQ